MQPAATESKAFDRVGTSVFTSFKEGVPVKVVSERLGHANIAFTIQTYQHVLPGMQADAARVYERLAAPVPPDVADTVERRGNSRRKTARTR